MKNFFFTSDWHIDHDNALIYDKRPFNNLGEMRQILIYKYNKLVTPEDTCIFTGDMAYKPHHYIDFFSCLNGTKILVCGNHDGSYNQFYNAGFNLVLDNFSFTFQGLHITVSHFPLLGIKREDKSFFEKPSPCKNWHGDHKPKNHKYCFNYIGQDIHIHGHIHSRKDKPQSKTLDGIQYDVGAPANHYRPIQLSEIISKIQKSKRV